ncbi:MAG: hypothetical protein IT426_04210 [Pirellulales bacterium]|nr:hypothetical protein [Pirellulales bacterium]
MRPSNTIAIRGPRGRPALVDFSDVVKAMQQCLSNVCRCIAKTDEIEFEVSDLHISSAVISTSPVSNTVPIAILSDVSNVFDQTFSALEDGSSLDPRLDFPALLSFSKFSKILSRPGIQLVVGKTQLTGHYSDRIKSLVEPYSSSLGSVSGRLEAVSIHREPKFTLFPSASNEGVECIFIRNNLRNVLAAVDRTVTVYGKLSYSRSKIFPSRVEVEEFEILPDPAVLPTLLDMRGMLQSNMPSQDMIREIRDEW